MPLADDPPIDRARKAEHPHAGEVTAPLDEGLAPSSKQPLEYVPQLDGIRALAILIVLVGHSLPSYPILNKGLYGVRIFFVLSGFLITQILIRLRHDADAIGQPRGRSLRQFYSRRTLRIFPAYYLALTLGIVGGVMVNRDAIPWFITYTANYYTVFFDKPHGPMNHFWSLCVEEQFYLVWPLLVLVLPRRGLLPFAVFIIIASTLYRAVLVAIDARFHVVYENTLTSLDSLLLGAVLAMAVANAHEGVRAVLARLGWFVALPVIAISYAAEVAGRAPGVWMNMLILPIAANFVGLALIDRACRPGRWLLGPIFEWRPMRWIGQISYGLYLYHMVIYGVSAVVVTRLGYQWTDLGFVRIPMVLALTFAVASASFYLIERPINSMKSRFPYVPRSNRAALPL